MIPDQRGIVRRGYDHLSYAYRPDDTPDDYLEYADWAAELTRHVPDDACVLDLGCGCGLPLTRLLSRRYDVTGIDVSPVQIERARRLVPGAHFRCVDALDLELPEASFAAVVSFYAIIHMPLAAHPELFRRIAHWLRPGGVFFGIVGHSAWTGTEPRYLDVDGGLMAWSHADEATNLLWLREAGFSIDWHRFIPEGESGHTLVLART